jgi:hypothetical protein
MHFRKLRATLLLLLLLLLLLHPAVIMLVRQSSAMSRLRFYAQSHIHLRAQSACSCT